MSAIISLLLITAMPNLLLAASNKQQLSEVIEREKQNSSQLTKVNVALKQLEKSLEITNENAQRLLRGLRSKRAKLQAEQRKLRREAKATRRELSVMENELVRAKTNLKLGSDAIEEDTVRLKIQELAEQIVDLKAQLESTKQRISEQEERIDTLSPEYNTTYVTLSDDQTLLEEDLLTERRKAVTLRRNARELKRKRTQLQTKVQQEINLARALPTVVATPVKSTKPAQSTNQKKNPLSDSIWAVQGEDDEPSAYVFLFSGEQDTDIEKTLRLKEWTESFGAKLFTSAWNDVYNKAKADSTQTTVVNQMRDVLRVIPEDSSLIIIGHGLGGGTALRVATESAVAVNRRVDYLVTIDPVGENKLRANIVNKPQQEACIAPKKDGYEALAYFKCMRQGQPRTISSNVLNFYNRWQKESPEPAADYYSKLELQDETGVVEKVDTATGRFRVPATTRSDQQRVFFNNKKAGHLLLSEASKDLPNLLVEFLR